MKYVPVIGLEVHSQLKTNSKIFCGCANRFGAEPNTQTCPVCSGFPGVLPVLNKKVVEYAVKAGLALNCEIPKINKNDRKNYFYPDLPKAYQISQFDQPMCGKGFLKIRTETGEKVIGITRIHIEEDAGKLVHSDDFASSNSSFADYNRCGTPLIEIVSEPEISNPEEAYQYLVNLKHILEYIEVSDCNMEEGSLRCDANVSVMPEGSEKFGTKTELKNMNSFKAVRTAIESEIKRQINELENGGTIIQETRLWDENKGVTVAMRTKEEAHDYRYFPDPDLVQVELSDEFIDNIKKNLPELPQQKKERFLTQYSLPETDADVLIADKYTAEYFEKTVSFYDNPKKIANWIMVDFTALLNENKISVNQSKILPENLAELVELIDKNVISGKIAKSVFREMFETGKKASVIVNEKGLVQITDTGEIEKIVDQVIADNPGPAEQVRAGKDKAKGFFVGQIMRLSKGKANPQIVNELLDKKLKG